MSEIEPLEAHALRLGKLVGNLLSLEMGARMTIVKLDKWEASQVQTQLPGAKEGDLVELNAFTNADDLNQTLEKYNKRAPSECKLDIVRIVELRDALGHGRMFGFGPVNPKAPLRLLKFSKKTNGRKVKVVAAVDMTASWFIENLDMLNRSLKKVAIALDYEMGELARSEQPEKK